MSRYGSLDGLPDGAGAREALFSVRYSVRNAEGLCSGCQAAGRVLSVPS